MRRLSNQLGQASTGHTRLRPRGSFAPAMLRWRRTALTLAVGMSFALSPLTAIGDSQIVEEGRVIRTEQKAQQLGLDEYVLDAPHEQRPTGRTLRSTGRYLRAAPTQPVSVGLVGCPGCTAILQAMGGVFVDVNGRRRLDRDPATDWQGKVRPTRPDPVPERVHPRSPTIEKPTR